MAFLAVFSTLGGPGITIDEPLDVRPGKNYVEALRRRGLSFFDRTTVDRVFRDNAEHPPLGRWLLGISATLAEPFEGLLPGGPDPFGVHAARLAPATAFALLVGFVALAATRGSGRAGGLVAGFSLVLMPRVFAHAHLAALDTFVCLTWTTALLAADRALAGRWPVAGMALAGVAFGLALLTKIHAWFLPPILLTWAFARLGPGRAVAAWSAWVAVGYGVFVAGWPWLWYDSAARIRTYLGTGVERIPLRVQYFGEIYLDRDVPWHYPWFYFAATVPVGLHALGLLGLWRGWRGRRADPLPLLLAGSIAAFLLAFSTRAPVYDGERLFLLAFPLWAILIGAGFAEVWRRAGRAWMRVALAAFVAGQGYGVVALHPFGLSYYNAIVGGLPGAERMGLELTYWGDAVDGVLLDRLVREATPGQSAALVPTLHHIQATASLTPALVARRVTLGDSATAAKADWIVAFRRDAYLPPEIRVLLGSDLPPPTFERRRQGVRLSAIYRSPTLANPSSR